MLDGYDYMWMVRDGFPPKPRCAVVCREECVCWTGKIEIERERDRESNIIIIVVVVMCRAEAAVRQCGT
jgi:hypothetical protein